MHNSQTEPSVRPVRPASSRPILLADDNPGNAELLRHALQRTGTQNPLHAVSSGDEAISYLRGEGQYANRAKFPVPHLLLLEPDMPGRSGWEVLQWVRERPKFSLLLVMIFGGSGSQAEEDRAYQLGANACHTKPSVAGELDKVVIRIGQFWLLSGNL